MRVTPRIHAVPRSRELCARALGYAWQDWPEHYGLHPRGASTVAPGAAARPRVALVHGTSRADKEWPEAHWVALARRLDAVGLDVALLHGSDEEQRRSERLAAALPNAQVWPRMSLDALTDAMATCAGVIGVDSGLSHIAVALDLPHVQIYNFDTAWRTGPGGTAGLPRQRSIHAPVAPSVDVVWQAWLDVSAR